VRRRAFLATVAGSLLAAPLAALAQQGTGKIPLIGLLDYSTPDPARLEWWKAFRQALRELGYVEGQSIRFEARWAEGRPDRLPGLAAELVGLRVDVIVTGGGEAARAAKQATATIPIVMTTGSDPVKLGIVESLARPGGNVTGLCSDASHDMSGKNLALLSETLPGLKRVGVLQQAGLDGSDLQAFADKLNLELVVVEVRKIDEIESALAMLRRRQVGAVYMRGSVFYVPRQRVAQLALENRLPALHALREHAYAGLLMTYGANISDLYRRAATYVDRIVKGANPADLPVEQPVKFELVINLKTAKALGIAIPPAVLLRADDVIR
jgi:putative ABC transport system substrate-binding protein